MEAVEEDNWDHFTLGVFKMKKVPNTANKNGTEHVCEAGGGEFSDGKTKQRVRRTNAQFAKGSVSKAAKAAME